MRDTPDCEHAASGGELVGVDAPFGNLASRRGAVRRRRARVRRDDVPEEDIILDAELGQDAVDDCRGRLGGATTGEQALRRERNPGDAGAAIAGCLPDQEDACTGT